MNEQQQIEVPQQQDDDMRELSLDEIGEISGGLDVNERALLA